MDGKYKAHPIAEIFPMIAEDSFEKLKSDIETNGIKEFGLLYEGKILDGRNRYRAARELGIDMTFSEVELGEPEEIAAFDPVSYVMSQNLHRRHLKQSQRAMIAAKMATLKKGTNQHTSKDVPSECDAAQLLSVSVPSLQRAKHVLEHGSKDLIDAVESESITVSMAEKLCKNCEDKKQQSKLVKEGKAAIKEFLKPAEKPGNCDPVSANADGVSVLVGIRRNLKDLAFEQLIVMQEYVASLIKEKESTR